VDPVLSFIIQKAAQTPKIQRVLLFGSRAREDHHSRSDYDFAIDAPQLTDLEWATWASAVREGIPTLCGVDVLRLDKASEALATQVQQEGKLLYER
jgi:predicted nucleotidyltransferase